MARFDFDDLLRDLAVPRADAPREPSPARPAAVPSSPGPAPGRAPVSLPQPGDEHLSDLWIPDEAARPAAAGDLGQLLLSRGTVDAERLLTAQRVLRRTPGKRLAALLVEMGTDEAAVQEAVAVLARIPF